MKNTKRSLSYGLSSMARAVADLARTANDDIAREKVILAGLYAHRRNVDRLARKIERARRRTV